MHNVMSQFAKARHGKDGTHSIRSVKVRMCGSDFFLVLSGRDMGWSESEVIEDGRGMIQMGVVNLYESEPSSDESQAESRQRIFVPRRATLHADRPPFARQDNLPGHSHMRRLCSRRPSHPLSSLHRLHVLQHLTLADLLRALCSLNTAILSAPRIDRESFTHSGASHVLGADHRLITH